jgi:hypothetical protein
MRKSAGPGLLVFLLAGIIWAQYTQPLFYIEHSINSNKLYYEAAFTKDSAMDPKRPVHAYWIMWAKDSSGATRQKMSWIEKQRAFGFKIKRDPTKTQYCLSLVAYPTRIIEILTQDAKAVARTIINEKRAYLEKIHIDSDDDHLFPKVNYLELVGRDVETGQELHEQVAPSKK